MEKCIKGIGKMCKKQKQTVNIVQYVPYQLCPKCNGEGEVLKNVLCGSPTSISSGFETCNLCHGKMVIPMCIVKPEEISLTNNKSSFLTNDEICTLIEINK
jgi:hypothetical protein